MAFLDDTGVEYLAADIKALADNDYMPIAPTLLSGLTAGTNVSLGTDGGLNYVMQIGKLIIVTLNFQITANISSGSTLISGFPEAKRQVSCAAARGGSTYSAAIRIRGNSTNLTADGAISQTGWYDACFIYETT